MGRWQMPKFAITDAQKQFLDSTMYKNAPPESRAATIAARLISGDPSAGTATPEQNMYVNALRRQMGLAQ
jgi:hypothetical protein